MRIALINENSQAAKNEIIFKEGDSGKTMYDIVSGTVGIFANYGTADQNLLTKLGAEEFFGEMGMIEELPRSATAVALEPTEAKVITKENFKDYITEKPAKALTVLEYTSRRLRRLSFDYIEACAAIAEYVKADEKGEKPSDELMKKLKTIDAAAKAKK